MTDFHIQGAQAIADLGRAVAATDADAVAGLVDEIAAARRIALYGVGREGLMMKALAMRLFHLGCDAHVVGDMSTPPIGPGDLLIVSAGPGDFSTVSGLVGVARQAGARTACITAEPAARVPQACDRVLVLPAQTMANDQGGAGSILPMGSLFEGTQYVVFELIVLALRPRLDQTPEAMRARHTNLE